MDDLIAFVKARLDEEEAAAKAAAERTGSPDWHLAETGDGRDVVMMGAHEHGCHAVLGAHIALHDPARERGEVAAKRRILAEYKGAVAITGEDDQYAAGLAMAILSFAAVWSGHPDYRDEWKP